MGFCVDTVYDSKTLLAFNRFFLRSRIWFFLFLLISTALVSFAFALSIVMNFCDVWMVCAFALVCIVDISTVLTHFVAPHFALKKSPVLNATVHFEFDAVNYTVSAKNEKIDERSISAYSTIIKARETKSHIYLFISSMQAYIIDKNGFSLGDPDGLVDHLISKGVKYKK